MRSNLEIIRDHYAASDRRDLADMLADVAPDARWTEMAGFPCAGTWIGPEQITEHVFAALGAEWDPFTFALEQLIDGGERIVALGDYKGTHRTTGKSMQARVTHVWKLSQGRIVAFEQFTDTLLVDIARRP
jgi:ketosteroid isomerase-like protein